VSGRLRSITGHTRTPLLTGWQLAAAPPDGADGAAPPQLNWIGCRTPGTVAASLRDAGLWSLDGPPRRFDGEDWWFRTRFRHLGQLREGRTVLGFDGLATVADVWLNGVAVLSSRNMFLAHEIPVDELLAAENELVMRFRSLDALLAQRRPRPRWRAPMIEHQQLRWWRTTVLGRTPGWSPPAAAVGPWRSVWLEQRKDVEIPAAAICARVIDGAGVVTLDCDIRCLDGAALRTANLMVERGGRVVRAPLQRVGEDGRCTARARIERPELWWPHTHGLPALYAACLEIELDTRDGHRQLQAQLGEVGFRTLVVDANGEEFRLRVNDVPVFCRGACWTPLDAVDPGGSAGCREAIGQVRHAGMNMLRVAGTMVYESDAFLDECDAQGVMLWQEFMFANMDYPDDASFQSSVAQEARQQLCRWSGRPSVAVLCGNSEVEQQAAMWGATREHWSPRLFHEVLPELVRQHAADLCYWPSSAHGGAFPHQNDVGTTSYYGVGAYLRPLEDARRSQVRFATECLAFANIPEESCIARMPGGAGLKSHHPQWKARTPRDLGAGWDFEDVRDHYLRHWAGVDPVTLRYADHDRYLELGRVVTGEVMHAAFAEWRRQRSACGGALVWFLRDLWPGAGWGVLDASGDPKAVWYYLRRALQPRALFFSDEGCNGLALHVINEAGAPLRATLSLRMFRGERAIAGESTTRLVVPQHSTIEVAAASLLDGFSDLSYAYRFGPPPYEVAVGTLIDDDSSSQVAQAFHLPGGPRLAAQTDPGIEAVAMAHTDGAFQLEVRSRAHAQAVTIRAPGFWCEDQYFNLAPGGVRKLALRPFAPAGTTLRGAVHALNGVVPAPITVAG
jgi:beta-mannosidase